MEVSKTKIGVLAFVMLGIGILIGYGAGFAAGIKFTIMKGYEFLRASGVDFSLSAEQIAQIVNAYKEKIVTLGGSTTQGLQIINP